MYTIAGLRETVKLSLSQDMSDIPEHLLHETDLPVAPLFMQRRWCRISREYNMSQFAKGAKASDVMKYVMALHPHRHRDTSYPMYRQAEAKIAELAGLPSKL